MRTTEEIQSPTLCKDLAASKIQALYRGHYVRSRTVLPDRLIRYIDFRGLSLDFIHHQLVLVARAITEVLSGNEPWKEYHHFKNTFFKVHFSVKKKSKIVHIQFPVFPDTWKREGGYKKVSFAQTLVLRMKPIKYGNCYIRRTLYTPSVRITMRETPLHPLVAMGMHYHAELHKRKPPGIYLTEPLRKLGPNTYDQNWCGTDISTAAKIKEVSFDNRCSEGVKPISKKELLHCLKDVVKSVFWMHKEGFAHNDLNLGNILIKLDLDKDRRERFFGYIADFDHLRPFGYIDKVKTRYFIWDPCLQNRNIGTPYGDLFALAVHLVKITNRDFYPSEICRFRDRIFSDTLKGRLMDANFYIRFGLSNSEWLAWQFLHRVCWESSLIYRELNLIQNPKTINQVEVKNALDEVQLQLSYHDDPLIDQETLLGKIDQVYAAI